MRVLRILHKWLGLIVGIQVLLWTVSGLAFAWLDHGEVQAEDKACTPLARQLRRDIALAEPQHWLHEYRGAAIADITLAPLLDRDVYRIRLNGRTELRRAEDGARFAIDEAWARRLADAHYAGRG
ncbi:MAG: peptidase, partial [Gemmatimonadetes bacterium]|nr:peptidase [Gemmatimonadota bacterium]